MSDDNPVRIERPHEGIAVVVLDRPAQLNAMKPSTMPTLVSAFESLSSDDSARVVVLTGAGRGFCTGMDLSALDEMAPMNLEAQTAWMRMMMGASVALELMPQPTIAAVNGPATGGGFGYAMACDLRVAGPSAVFAATFVRMAMGPDAGLSVSLPRTIGYARAVELLLTGDVVNADEALALGIVSRVVDDPLAESIELARRIAKAPAHALQSVKATLRTVRSLDPEEAIDIEARAQAGLVCHPDWMDNAMAWMRHHLAQPALETRLT